MGLLPPVPPRGPDRPFDVVGFGQNAVDHLVVVPWYPPYKGKVEVKTYEVQGGAQVATALVACARLGLRTRYIGKVGGDDLGRLSVESLRSEGVDVGGVRTVAGASTQVGFIVIDAATGERTVLWRRDPRLAFEPGEVGEPEVAAARVLHLDVTDCAAAEEAARLARQRGVRVCMDADRVAPGVEPLLRRLDVLIASESFPATLTGVADRFGGLRALREHTGAFLCVTLGSDGCIALLGDRVHHSPGFPVDAADTTGAGDVFHGAFLAGWLAGWPVTGILRFANAAAAIKCTRLGGRPGIPREEEVRRFLAARGAAPPEVP